MNIKSITYHFEGGSKLTIRHPGFVEQIDEDYLEAVQELIGHPMTYGDSAGYEVFDGVLNHVEIEEEIENE